MLTKKVFYNTRTFASFDTLFNIFTSSIHKERKLLLFYNAIKFNFVLCPIALFALLFMPLSTLLTHHNNNRMQQLKKIRTILL